MPTGESRNAPGEQPVPAQPLATRRSATAAVLATLMVTALGGAIFASLSAHRTGPGATAKTPASTRTLAGTTAVAPSPTLGTSQVHAPMHGAGLPEGMEVITFAPTGIDEGWGTGGVITNPVSGVPDRGTVLHYAGGAWMQVGPALPGVYLGGLDMVSSSEGWALGGDGSGHGLLLHIRDGGWQQVSLPAADPQGAPAVMAMRTADEGWLAMADPKGAQGEAHTSLLHDVGGTWSLVSNPLQYITAIAPVADSEAWVIGWNADSTSSLVHVQSGVATVELTSPTSSTFTRLRMLALNDIWIEGARHATSNADIDDVPLVYHYDGAAWSNVPLHQPNGVQHAGIAASDTVWGFASAQLPPPNETAYGVIASIYSEAGGQWMALSVPYQDLQSLAVVSHASADDVWAVGVYMVTTQLPNHNGAPSYASVSHYVLLHYTGGAWTEYGR